MLVLSLILNFNHEGEEQLSFISYEVGNKIILINEKEFLNSVEHVKSDVIDVLESSNLDEKLNDFIKKWGIPSSIVTSIMNVATNVHANEVTTNTDKIGDKLQPLIDILQDLALPIGIIVSLWGLIEIIIGNLPSGKEKIKYAIIGFLGFFIIPEIFYTIREVFQ